MNLIEVLKNNGTGLLEGLCRLCGVNTNFIELFDDLKLEYDCKVSIDESAEISFSLNDKHLGTFEARIYEVQLQKGILKAEILNPNNKKEIICWLNIFWSDDEFFTKFQAILKNKPYELLTIIKS